MSKEVAGGSAFASHTECALSSQPTQQARGLVWGKPTELGSFTPPDRTVLSGVGQHHLFLLDWRESATAHICGWLTDFSIELSSQVIGAPSAFAAGLEQSSLDQIV